MEIFIVAVMTGLGIIGGMFVIWRGYHPTQVSTTSPEGSGNDSQGSRKEIRA